MLEGWASLRFSLSAEECLAVLAQGELPDLFILDLDGRCRRTGQEHSGGS